MDLAFSDFVDFSNYGQLLPLVQNSLYAGAALGLLGGLVGVFVIARDLPFAVHGISEMSFAGAAAALLLGGSVVVGSFAGSLVAAALIAALGARARERNSVIGVLMPFGLGLGILFLALHEGRSANKFGLLTGQVVAVDDDRLTLMATTAVVVAGVLAVIWRPLMFASVDPEVAAARGVPVGLLHWVFMLLLGATIAVAVQVVGALLVLALLCTPTAAAIRLTTSPVLLPLVSSALALTAMLGGTLLALGTAIPISPYVTTISFVIYLVARVIGRPDRRGTAESRGEDRAVLTEAGSATAPSPA
jgi:zinc/manganese transport system permease protein